MSEASWLTGDPGSKRQELGYVQSLQDSQGAGSEDRQESLAAKKRDVLIGMPT
jgi:hypothetical protein